MKLVTLTILLLGMAVLSGSRCGELEAPRFAEGNLFVLSAPSTASEGNDSIISIDPSGRAEFFVLPDSALNGTRELDFNSDHTVLYALQSNFQAGVHRIVLYDAFANVIDEIPIAGGSLQAMAANVDEKLYVAISAFGPEPRQKIVKVDPQTKDVTDFVEFGAPFSTGDMDRDEDGNLYLTTSSPGADSILKIDPDGTVTVFADDTDGLDQPFGITYDQKSQAVWVANSRGSQTAQIFAFDREGAGDYYADVSDYFQPNVRGLAIDPEDGRPVATLGDFDRVVRVAPDSSVTGIGDADIHWPKDVDFVAGSPPPVPDDVIPITFSSIGFGPVTFFPGTIQETQVTFDGCPAPISCSDTTVDLIPGVPVTVITHFVQFDSLGTNDGNTPGPDATIGIQTIFSVGAESATLTQDVRFRQILNDQFQLDVSASPTETLVLGSRRALQVTAGSLASQWRSAGGGGAVLRSTLLLLTDPSTAESTSEP